MTTKTKSVQFQAQGKDYTALVTGEQVEFYDDGRHVGNGRIVMTAIGSVIKTVILQEWRILPLEVYWACEAALDA